MIVKISRSLPMDIYVLPVLRSRVRDYAMYIKKKNQSFSFSRNNFNVKGWKEQTPLSQLITHRVTKSQSARVQSHDESQKN